MFSFLFYFFDIISVLNSVSLLTFMGELQAILKINLQNYMEEEQPINYEGNLQATAQPPPGKSQRI